MASVKALLIRSEIALLNPLMERLELQAQRDLQDALGLLSAREDLEHIRFLEEPEYNAAWANPESPVPDKAILYLHGGAYTAGSLTYARGFGSKLADCTGWMTYCLGYRLAPENPFPAALEDALCAYERLLEEFSPANIAFVGESAGGGLCYCLSLKCKELGFPQPACIVALSPWTDLSMSGGECEDDPVLRRDNLLERAAMYAGDDLKNPLVSPLFGNLEGLPDSLIFAGDMEILEDDAIRMAQKLREAGCRCELHVKEGMWHVFVLYGIPEAKQALSRITEYLAEASTHAGA